MSNVRVLLAVSVERPRRKHAWPIVPGATALRLAQREGQVTALETALGRRAAELTVLEADLARDRAAKDAAADVARELADADAARARGALDELVVGN